MELLWTYDGSGVDENVRKARSYQKEFSDFAKELDQINASRLQSYLERISQLLMFTPDNNTIDNPSNDGALGKRRLIKPKDLDYILNDSSLKEEWSNVAKISLAHKIKDKLTELKTIMLELTL